MDTRALFQPGAGTAAARTVQRAQDFPQGIWEGRAAVSPPWLWGGASLPWGGLSPSLACASPSCAPGQSWCPEPGSSRPGAHGGVGCSGSAAAERPAQPGPPNAGGDGCCGMSCWAGDAQCSSSVLALSPVKPSSTEHISHTDLAVVCTPGLLFY